MAEVEDRLTWLQALVVNQWKTGKAAELKLYCENGNLKVSVSADFGPPTTSWRADTAGASWGAGGRASPSRLRRRQRRSAARAEVAAGKHAYAAEDAEKAAQESTAEKNAAEKEIAEKAVTVKAAPEKESAEIAAAAKEVSEKKAAKMKAAEKTVADMVKAENVATTSCTGRQLPDLKNCGNCKGEMSNSHQCDSENDTPPQSPVPSGHQCDDSPAHPKTTSGDGVSGTKVPTLRKLTPAPAPLPLCHYCCHLGSGLNPVHYYVQCLCPDKVCSCQCYCNEEQLEHKRKFFPNGFSGVKCVDVQDRPRAQAIAEERANKLDFRGTPMAQRPCEAETCINM